MKQSVLEYKKLLEQKGLLVEFAEPEGKEGEDRPVTLVTYFSGGADQSRQMVAHNAVSLQRSCIQRGILKRRRKPRCCCLCK